MKLLLILLIITAMPVFSWSGESVASDNTVLDSHKEKQDESRGEHETLYSFISLYQPYVTNISAYEPVYFLVGTDPEKSKFQFSFKYRFLNGQGGLVKNLPWTYGIHFGYTQTSFWNLEDKSKPFEDTSYKPELFHVTNNLNFKPDWVQGFFIKSGIRHESNGQSEDMSRSSNFIYIKPIFVFYDNESKWGMGIGPEVWAYYDNSETGNPDLPDYRGYFELNIVAGKADSVIMNSNLRWAKKGGSIQLDLSYPLHKYLVENLKVYLHVQYVNGIAEGLLNYRDRTEAFRLGFSFVR